MKVIKANLSSNSIEEAKNKLLLLKDNLEEASKLIMNDMANLVETQVKNNYSASPYTDGNDDVNFIKKQEDKRTIVGVRGSQVLYREFGTGTEGLNAPHPIKGEFSLNGYNTGSKIKVNSKTGELFWIYKNDAGEKVYTQGIPAGKEVYNAAIILKGKKYTIIKKRVGEALSKL